MIYFFCKLNLVVSIYDIWNAGIKIFTSWTQRYEMVSHYTHILKLRKYWAISGTEFTHLKNFSVQQIYCPHWRFRQITEKMFKKLFHFQFLRCQSFLFWSNLSSIGQWHTIIERLIRVFSKLATVVKYGFGKLQFSKARYPVYPILKLFVSVSTQH